MTIERGQPWGEPTDVMVEGPGLASDAELAAAAAAALRDGRHLVASLTGGDLLATLGLGEGRTGSSRVAYPVDLGLAELGPGGPAGAQPFVAHLTVRDRPRLSALLGHGPGITIAVMNTPLLGDLRLGPRAHPNDGRLDVTVGRPPLRERREATRRARAGAHLPHPAMTTSRVAEWETTLDRPAAVYLDGVERGRFGSIRVTIVPDALTVIA